MNQRNTYRTIPLAASIALVLLLLTPAHADTLLVSSSRTDSVLAYDDQTGAFLGKFVTSGSGGLDFPVGIARGNTRIRATGEGTVAVAHQHAYLVAFAVDDDEVGVLKS